MTLPSLWRAGAPILLLALAGCDAAIETSPANTFDTRFDSCAIALASAGPDDGDGRIQALQARVRAARDPLPHLERLGWAFVAAARSRFDPGYLRLAEQCASCIDATQPGHAGGLLLRGHVLHGTHHFAEGEVLARELVARRGAWPDYALLGDVLMEQGKLAPAIEAYQRMADLRPGPQAYARVAHVRWLTGDLGGAINVLQMATGPGGFRDRESSAWVRVRLGDLLLQAGDAGAALTQWNAALALFPDYPPALLARGRLRLWQGDNAAALHDLARSAAGNPLPEYRWALVEALQSNGDLAQARAQRAALLAHGSQDDPRSFALFLATAAEQSEHAVTLARVELERRRDVFTLDAYAWALHANGRTEEAWQFASRALAEGTRDARLWLHAGVIASAAGHLDEAKRYLRAARKLEATLLPSERARLHNQAAMLEI